MKSYFSKFSLLFKEYALIQILRYQKILHMHYALSRKYFILLYKIIEDNRNFILHYL